MFTFKARLHDRNFKEVIILLKFGAIWITFNFLGFLGLSSSKQFIQKINVCEVDKGIKGCWAKGTMKCSTPYTDHRHLSNKYVGIRRSNNQWVFKREGFSHDGSLRAEKIENDDSRAALEQACTIDLKTGFGSSQAL